ncbi:MAG: flagellar protein FlgN [Pseudochelatococcus sp.]|jgi:hypothetical protein|uniref:flagellar protein FlgN n=1 Tax=Pseudochelatococcus sp. TaxID=2020869 RepID=UPI003D8BC3AC
MSDGRVRRDEGGAVSPEGGLVPGSRDVAGVPAHAALRQVLHRLEAALDAESEFLRQGLVGDFDAIMHRKSQCLLDLGRLSRAVTVEALASDEERRAIGRDVARIRDRLRESEEMLARYLEAAREITAIVNESARIADSDGTYAESGPFGRYGR